MHGLAWLLQIRIWSNWIRLYEYMQIVKILYCNTHFHLNADIYCRDIINFFNNWQACYANKARIGGDLLRGATITSFSICGSLLRHCVRQNNDPE
jgi:hypothetical protein